MVLSSRAMAVFLHFVPASCPHEIAYPLSNNSVEEGALPASDPDLFRSRPFSHHVQVYDILYAAPSICRTS